MSRITTKYIPILKGIEQLLVDSWKGALVNIISIWSVLCSHYSKDILDLKRLESQLV